MAFAIMCLEEAVLRLAQDVSWWEWLLKRLWSYTSTADLDEWQENAAELIPSVVVASEDYADGGFERLTADEFTNLRELYASNDPLLGQMVDLVFEIGTLEMFGGLENGAPVSLEKLSTLVRLMAEHSLCEPEVSVVASKSFAQCHGWGSPFEWGPLSRILMVQIPFCSTFDR
ncbi:MAG: hypothetical protein HY898_07315 [Deltaproteobacteria bacterium]|nr:hypothetical protein [Deltaproteobacteria bacterium]